MRYLISSEKGTDRLGALLVDSVESSKKEGSVIVALSGEMGAGKTTLVKSVGKALGVKETVQSPTFTMINEYHSGRLPLYHLDLYRVGESLERVDDGVNCEEPSLALFVMEFEEILDSTALVMIEWPQFFIVESELYLNGLDRIELQMIRSQQSEQARQLVVSATGRVPATILDSLSGNLVGCDDISSLSNNLHI